MRSESLTRNLVLGFVILGVVDLLLTIVISGFLSRALSRAPRR